MRLEIRYSTEFAYPSMVRESHNVLRACPATDANQTVIGYKVFSEPASRVLSYTDYWGTRVDTFGIRKPHNRLVVAADSSVETSARPDPNDIRLPAAEYRNGEIVTRFHEYLQRSPHTGWDVDVAGIAAGLVSSESDLVTAVSAIHLWVGERLDYVPGATYVGMDVNEVHQQRQGVCQDFAHLAIAMYRSQGIPARYVSGYFYALDQSVGTAPEEAEIEVQTHAWVEVMIPSWGWWALDPTNLQSVGDRHVKIGHGRDYDDVLPLRGTYHGTETHELGVAVHITRERLSQQ